MAALPRISCRAPSLRSGRAATGPSPPCPRPTRPTSTGPTTAAAAGALGREAEPLQATLYAFPPIVEYRPTVNGHGFPPAPMDPELPPSLRPVAPAYGPAAPGSFTSEYGVG